MAVLTTDDYRELRRALFAEPATNAGLKALPNLPSKSQLLAAFQAIEDAFTTFRSSVRAAVATAFGLPSTAALPAVLSRQILAHYCAWKFRAIFKE